MIYKNKETDYMLVFKSLTVFGAYTSQPEPQHVANASSSAALCLAALLWTSTTGVVCFRNFGAGLKYHSASPPSSSEPPLTFPTVQKNANSAAEAKDPGRYMLESANNSRMSID